MTTSATASGPVRCARGRHRPVHPSPERPAYRVRLPRFHAQGRAHVSTPRAHVLLDNSPSHGTPEVRARLAQHPQVHFHYTPTSASWLIYVEGFFSILGKQSLSLIDFHSTRALRAYFEAHVRPSNHNSTRLHGPNRRARSSAHTVACLISYRQRGGRRRRTPWPCGHGSSCGVRHPIRR